MGGVKRRSGGTLTWVPVPRLESLWRLGQVSNEHFVLQGGDGGGRLVDHVAFVGNVKEAGDEEDEKAGSRGSLSRTLGS